jgi:hypothetical protein
MSSAIDTTVDFRRKLLRFDRPLYPRYIKSDIPRFYSSFVPNWRSYYTGPANCNPPEQYPIAFPLRDIEYNGCVEETKETIHVKLFDFKIILLALLVIMFFASERKLIILALIAIVYYTLPTIEFFNSSNLRPVLQRGSNFYNPSFHRDPQMPF